MYISEWIRDTVQITSPFKIIGLAKMTLVRCVSLHQQHWMAEEGMKSHSAVI